MRPVTPIMAGLLLVLPCAAAHKSAAAEHTFDVYAACVEQRLARQHADPDTYVAIFNLGANQRLQAERELVSGGLQIEPVNGGTWQAPGGLLHHWRGEAFVRGRTPRDMLALLRDFNHLSSYYAPEVISSRVVSQTGDTAVITMRLKEQSVIAVVLDAEYAVHTGIVDNSRGYEISQNKHIWQIDNTGTASEHRRPEGQDEGFLWRLNSYWSFVRWRDGLLIECEAVSLTRSIPAGLGWLITPIIQDLPRQRLEFTLRATERALLANTAHEGRR